MLTYGLGCMSSIAYTRKAWIPLAESNIGMGQACSDDMFMSQLQLATAEPYTYNQMSVAVLRGMISADL